MRAPRGRGARAAAWHWTGAFLLLERLSPVERAVFLLRDVFAYGFVEIAGIVGKSESNCRQLVSRVRHHVAGGEAAVRGSRVARDQLARRFFAALGDGNMDELVSVLASDVIVYGDSGGRPPSWQRPIVGQDNVSRLMYGLGEQIRQLKRRHPPNGGQRSARRSRPRL